MFKILRSFFVCAVTLFSFLQTCRVLAQTSYPQSSPQPKRYYKQAAQGQQQSVQTQNQNQNQNPPQYQAQPQPRATPQSRRIVAKPAPALRVQVVQKPQLSLAPTHILPSAFVLPSGSFIVGTTTAGGIGNFMDVSTNLFDDIEQIYNVMVKFGLIKGRNLALSFWIEYTNQTEQYNGTDPNSGLPTILTTSFSSIDPGLTLSYRLGRNFTAHTGGNAAIQNPVITPASLSQRTAYIQGNTVHQEFTVGLNEDLALSFGGSYDLTYSVFGAGFSFHLDALQLGVHYYFNVAQGSILPIIGGSFPLNF